MAFNTMKAVGSDTANDNALDGLLPRPVPSIEKL